MSKMRFSKLFLSLFFIPLFVSGQSAENFRAGSANKLEGSVYVLSCFISGPDDAWTYDEKTKILMQLSEANKWLIDQAFASKISLTFERGNYGLKEDIKLPQIERGTASGNEKVDLVSTVLQKVGYKRPLDFYNWVNTYTKCQSSHVLIFVKGNGNSYAMPFRSNGNKELYFVEGAMIYEKYLSDRPLASSSIAHETLHLYGAWDMYKTYAQTQEKEDKARKLFPNSIMLRTSYNFQELNVDELTAWLIGWNSNQKDWYVWFKPKAKESTTSNDH